jgi:hypothetical protein
MFAYGFTSVESVAGAVYPSTEMREAIEAGNLIGPRLLTSSQLLEGNRASYSFARYVRNTDVADLECSKYKALDIDWIKSYVRAPIPFRTGSPGVRRRSAYRAPRTCSIREPRLAYRASRTCRRRKRMGYGWAKSPAGISYQDVTDILGKADMHLMETLGALRYVAGNDILLGGERFSVLMPTPYVNNILAQTPPTPAQAATIKIATDDDARSIQAGALFAIGTDTPLNAPGISNHTSLISLGKSISNFQAMQAVTINAAMMSYKDKDLGSVGDRQARRHRDCRRQPARRPEVRGGREIRDQERPRLHARADHGAIQDAGTDRCQARGTAALRGALQARSQQLQLATRRRRLMRRASASAVSRSPTM